MSPDDAARPQRADERAERRAAARRARQRRAMVAFGAPILAFFAIAIVHKSTSHGAAAATPPKHAVALSVGEENCTFVDASRTTPRYNDEGLGIGVIAGRRLVTEVRYPTIHPARGEIESVGAAPATSRGPFPLIVFAHGYDLTPDTYASLLDAWTRAGFVVVAPIFPDTNHTYVTALGGIGAPEADVVNQPEDVAFVSRETLGANAGSVAGCHVLRGLVAPSKGIGLAGQSDGAETVGMAAFDTTHPTSLAGIHVRAVAIMSGSQYGADHYGPAAGAPNVLVTQSATDQCNVPQASTALYNDITGSPKAFLEIDNASHLGPYDGSAPAAFTLVRKVTTAFFELSLDHDVTAAGFQAVGASAPSIGRLTVGGVAPPMPALEMDSAACYNA